MAAGDGVPALRAAELLTVDPGHRRHAKLITDYAATVAEPNGDPSWPSPEPRLTYANAVLPEAMIAAGATLDDPTLSAPRLGSVGMAGRLRNGGGRSHCLPPRSGQGADDLRPAFDQQPIEVSTLADACAGAAAIDTRPIWPDTVLAAAAWFKVPTTQRQLMWDPETGGGFDGLHANGVNRNLGAESTLALLSTLAACSALLDVSHDFVQAGSPRAAPVRLAADPRGLSPIFVPGTEGFERQDSRAGAVLARSRARSDISSGGSSDACVARYFFTQPPTRAHRNRIHGTRLRSTE